MQTYTIFVKATDVRAVDIEADSAKEAIDMAIERYVVNGEELPDLAYEENLVFELAE